MIENAALWLRARLSELRSPMIVVGVAVVVLGGTIMPHRNQEIAKSALAVLALVLGLILGRSAEGR